VLERVRDPFRLHEVLAAAGLPTPRLVPPGDPCPAFGRWLRKPLRSASGHGVRFAEPGEAASPFHYFQEFIDGPPMSAIFVGDTLFGVTEQLVGEPWLHAGGFAYCGTVGPAEPPAGVAELCRVLVAAFGLRGVWGLDFVRRDGVPYPVEVNPRYTAAVEVLEHGLGRGVFGGGLAATRSGAGAVGKAVYFAPHRVTFPSAGPWDADLAGDFDPWKLPAFADIPEPGTGCEPGQPVLTVFAAGSSPADCRDRLQSRAADLDRLFAETPR
jgi:predicted ATP-grasp superfamily ATP-dependent carboligase